MTRGRDIEGIMRAEELMEVEEKAADESESTELNELIKEEENIHCKKTPKTFFTGKHWQLWLPENSCKKYSSTVDNFTDEICKLIYSEYNKSHYKTVKSTKKS